MYNQSPEIVFTMLYEATQYIEYKLVKADGMYGKGVSEGGKAESGIAQEIEKIFLIMKKYGKRVPKDDQSESDIVKTIKAIKNAYTTIDTAYIPCLECSTPPMMAQKTSMPYDGDLLFYSEHHAAIIERGECDEENPRVTEVFDTPYNSANNISKQSSSAPMLYDGSNLERNTINSNALSMPTLEKTFSTSTPTLYDGSTLGHNTINSNASSSLTLVPEQNSSASTLDSWNRLEIDTNDVLRTVASLAELVPNHDCSPPLQPERSGMLRDIDCLMQLQHFKPHYQHLGNTASKTGNAVNCVDWKSFTGKTLPTLPSCGSETHLEASNPVRNPDTNTSMFFDVDIPAPSMFSDIETPAALKHVERCDKFPNQLQNYINELPIPEGKPASNPDTSSTILPNGSETHLETGNPVFEVLYFNGQLPSGVRSEDATLSSTGAHHTNECKKKPKTSPVSG